MATHKIRTTEFSSAFGNIYLPSVIGIGNSFNYICLCVCLFVCLSVQATTFDPVELGTLYSVKDKTFTLLKLETSF